MKLKIFIVALGTLLLSVSGNANSQETVVDGFKISICNICDTNALFQAYAESLDEGNHIILNLETIEARSYNIMLGPSKDGSGGVFKRIGFVPMPQEMSGILSELEEMEIIFDAILESMGGGNPSSANSSLNYMESNNLAFSSGSSDFTGNGCGSPSHWQTYGGIRSIEFPFLGPCNRHDVCYYEGIETKNDCDTQFIVDMLETLEHPLVDYYSYTHGLLGRHVYKKYLNKKARAFYWFVTNTEIARNAYCGNKDSSFAECGSGGEGVTGGSFFDTSTDLVVVGGVVYQQTCELWEFPDGFGGKYYMERNCSVSQIG